MDPAQVNAAHDASIVFVDYVGGPNDGLVVPVAPSLLLGQAQPIRVHKRTPHATHVYEAKRAFSGGPKLVLYYRRALRVVG